MNHILKSSSGVAVALMSIGLLLRSTLAAATNQPAAYYPFEGDAWDASGHNLNGTIHNASFVAGYVGSGLSFLGTDSFVEVPHDELLSPTNAVSIALWVKVRSFPKAYSCLVYKAAIQPTGSGFQDRSYSIWVRSDGGIHLTSTAADASTQTMCNSASRGILVNEWTHVVGVVDAKGQLMEVYINGTLVKSCPYSRAGIRHGSFPLRVGGPFITLWDQSGLDGVLDEVRIYHRALTDDDVVSLFEGTSFVPNLAIRVSQIEVCWDTSTSYDYQLQYRSDLTTNVWVPLSTNSVRGTGGLVCMSDTVVPGQPHRYYRVAVTEHVP